MLVILLSCLAVGCSQDRTFWPTIGWKTARPRQHGLDEELIADMLTEIEVSGLDLDGLVVVHEGAIVVEQYFHIYKESTLHETYSVTKSVISALVDIAVQQGCINSLDDPVLDYFPEREFLNMDENKAGLTIRNLITMSSGLAYDPDEMYASMDWTQYTLDQPQLYDPGQTWFYSNGGPQVLSELISRACEMDTLDFAEEFLFKPLRIREFQWQRGINGHPNGSWVWSLNPGIWPSSGIYTCRMVSGMESRSCLRTGSPFPVSHITGSQIRWNRGIFIMDICGGSMRMASMRLMDIRANSSTWSRTKSW